MVSPGVLSTGREAALQGAAHHGGDQLVHVGVLGGLCHDQIAVPQHGDLIADLKDLVHLVGDVDQSEIPCSFSIRIISKSLSTS